jgi:hypothetical protein
MKKSTKQRWLNWARIVVVYAIVGLVPFGVFVMWPEVGRSYLAQPKSARFGFFVFSMFSTAFALGWIELRIFKRVIFFSRPWTTN